MLHMASKASVGPPGLPVNCTFGQTLHSILVYFQLQPRTNYMAVGYSTLKAPQQIIFCGPGAHLGSLWAHSGPWVPFGAHFIWGPFLFVWDPFRGCLGKSFKARPSIGGASFLSSFLPSCLLALTLHNGDDMDWQPEIGSKGPVGPKWKPHEESAERKRKA